jgi:predicted RNA-binding protein with RPS1 domain
VVDVGDKLQVEITEIDQRGKISQSGMFHYRYDHASPERRQCSWRTKQAPHDA